MNEIGTGWVNLNPVPVSGLPQKILYLTAMVSSLSTLSPRPSVDKGSGVVGVGSSMVLVDEENHLF